MTHEHRLRLKTLLLILVMLVCTTVGDLSLKRAMTQIGPVQPNFPGLLHAFLLTIANPTLWIGIAFLTCYMICYMTVLSWADYSYVMPAGAFGYAAVTLLAVFFLGEDVSPRRWAGVALICAGIFLVGQTKPRTSEIRHKNKTKLTGT